MWVASFNELSAAQQAAARAVFDRAPGGARSSHDYVAQALGNDILSGVYPAGAKLPPEAEMLKRFGISRTVLREVFKTLTAKGLIVAKTRVGTTVLDSSHWNFFDADILSWKVSQEFDLDFIRSRSEEHTSELQSLMRLSYAVFCLK